MLIPVSINRKSIKGKYSFISVFKKFLKALNVHIWSFSFGVETNLMLAVFSVACKITN